MLLIIEILMLATGLWAIFTGKVPTFLIGGGKYQIEGFNARLYGILLILPFPLLFLEAIIGGMLFGEEVAEYGSVLEIVTVVVVGIIALILARIIGKPVALSDSTEALITKKTNGSLIYALLSATGIGAIVFCPLAFIYANQALRLIDENPAYGLDYRGRAKTARTIAAVFTLLWAAGIICFASLALTA